VGLCSCLRGSEEAEKEKAKRKGLTRMDRELLCSVNWARADSIVVEASTPTEETSAVESYVDIAPSLKDLEKKEKVRPHKPD
jgi:hypothetical protein